MRNMGGEPNEWCVGTARDRALDGKLPLQDSRETSPNLPGLAYREAHIPYAAANAVEYLASAFGLQPAPSSTPEPGKIVFVYRRSEVQQVVRALACHAVAT